MEQQIIEQKMEQFGLNESLVRIIHEMVLAIQGATVREVTKEKVMGYKIDGQLDKFVSLHAGEKHQCIVLHVGQNDGKYWQKIIDRLFQCDSTTFIHKLKKNEAYIPFRRLLHVEALLQLRTVMQQIATIQH